MAWRFDLADVAHYQDEAGALIDWDALKAGSPGNGAVTKLTQRNNYLDPTSTRHRSEMLRTGMRRRGMYHWLSPASEASVANQAGYFLSKLGVLERGEFVMLDAEQTGINEADAYEWIDRIMQVHQRPIAVYGGVSTAGGLVWRSARIRALGSCMWLAAYLTQAQLAAKLAALHIADLPMHVNQYSSSGPVAGVTGRCDMNQVNDFAVLDVCCGYSANQTGEEMIVNNKEIREGVPVTQYKFATNLIVKRHMGAEYGELQAAGATGVEVSLSNVALDAIPDYVAPTGGSAQHPEDLVLSGEAVIHLTGRATPDVSP